MIKTNTQQRYATTPATAAMFAELCREEEVPVQHYAHRTDLPCGSTIGPITSTLLGIATVDVGNAMLGHHNRYGGGTLPDSWNSAHLSRGCSQDALRASLGDGLFYCFAAD